jgi:hypothetical protein
MCVAGRHRYAMAEVREITGRIWKWVIAGIVVGALFHGYVPEDWVLADGHYYGHYTDCCRLVIPTSNGLGELDNHCV